MNGTLDLYIRALLFVDMLRSLAVFHWRSEKQGTAVAATPLKIAQHQGQTYTLRSFKWT